jgi:hypothetical protein
VRHSHGAEKNRIGPLARLEGRLGQGFPGLAIGLGAGLEPLVAQLEIAGPSQRGVDHLDARLHDLVADAVAGEDRDVEARGRCHSRDAFCCSRLSRSPIG